MLIPGDDVLEEVALGGLVEDGVGTAAGAAEGEGGCEWHEGQEGFEELHDAQQKWDSTPRSRLKRFSSELGDLWEGVTRGHGLFKAWSRWDRHINRQGTIERIIEGN